MNGKWTTNMKQKLDGHRKTPPAGLWESISSEMGLQNEPAPKTIAIKRWLWAAAVILALVGFFALYPFDQSEPLPQVAQTTYTTETPREPKSPITNKEESPENQQPNLVAKPIHEVREETVQQEISIEQPTRGFRRTASTKGCRRISQADCNGGQSSYSFRNRSSCHSPLPSYANDNLSCRG